MKGSPQRSEVVDMFDELLDNLISFIGESSMLTDTAVHELLLIQESSQEEQVDDVSCRRY